MSETIYSAEQCEQRAVVTARSATFADIRSSRNNNFDIIRLVLAVLVLFSHSFPLLQGNNRNEPLDYLTFRNLTLGGLAVDCFFIVSGFLITQSWLRSSGAGDYLKKRVLRIYPGFLVAVVISVFIIGPLGTSSPHQYLAWFNGRHILSFFVVASRLDLDSPRTFEHNPYPYLNGSLWTIPYEFWCYLLVAALGILGGFRSRRWLLALFTLAMALHIAQEMTLPGLLQGYNEDTRRGIFHDRSLWHFGYLDYWPRFLVCFLAGVTFWLYRDRIPRSPVVVSAAFVLLALSALWNINIGMPIFGAYLLLYAALCLPQRGQWITRHGDFSYGVYLYAFPIQNLIVRYFGRYLDPFTLFLAALPLTLLFAYCSWKWVESPLLRLKRAKPVTTQ